MSHSGCEDFLWWFCERQATDQVFKKRLLEAMRSPVEPLHAAVRVIQDADAAYAPTAKKEFEELPEFAMSTMLYAWLESADRGLRFQAHSVRPERPIEFARNRRVRVTVDEDQDSIQVSLSHIPTRHPARA